MNRIKKVRGQRKKWKDIAQWVTRHKTIDATYFETKQRDYVKIWVHPWSGISILNSEMAEPKGKTRKLMLEGLLTIYASWKKQLEARNEPYYLKIWLFDPYFSRSQVVCAVGDMLDFYQTTFYKPEAQKILRADQFGQLSSPMQQLTWHQHWDEFHFSQDDIGEPDDFASLQDYHENRRTLQKLMKSPKTRISTFETNGKATTYYAQKIGNVWVGG